MKTVYNWIAGLALLHLLALGGGIGYLISSGRLDAEQARRIAEVLKSEQEQDQEAAETSAPGTPARLASTVAESPEADRVADEIAWRNAERYRTQLEQRLKFIKRERVDVDRRREEFERLKERERQREQDLAKEQSQAGYAKELEILSSLKPKAVLRQIMAMDDAEAAQILFRLDTRKVKKVFEAAKTAEDLARITTIRRLIRDVKAPASNVGGSP